MISWLHVPRKRWIALLEQREDQVFLLLTLIIGALVGLVVVAFILLTQDVGMRLYPPGSATWRRFTLPVLGSLVIGYLLYRYFPDARGSGVPQTKAALFAREGRITIGTVLGKFFCTSATLASGIPLGREGPSVQVGAGIASILGRNLGLRPEKVKALIPVGTAAAIAAAFNTPLAAVLFSLEEVMGNLNAPILGSVVLASAVSWAVLRSLLGNHPLFDVPQYQLVSPTEFGVYAVLGIAGGLLSAAFSRLLLKLRHFFLRLPRTTQWWQPVTGGLAVGAMGLFVPQVLGVGYAYVGQALNGQMALRLMLVLLVLKFFAIIASYASGNAGGIFGPSLFLGAMLGGMVGGGAHLLFPATTATPGAYALVGMGCAFAGIVRAPMTSVLMIFEMTHDYAVIVPLMISNLISLFIASRLAPEPLYEALARQDGIHLPAAAARSGSDQRRVARIMKVPDPSELLESTMSIQEALERTRSSKFSAWIVTDGDGVAGVLSHARLAQYASESNDGHRALAELLDPTEFPHLHSDHTLHFALDRMSATHLDILPVVSRANIHHMEGVVSLRDVLNSYGFDSLGGARDQSPGAG
jgi:CIC family chloride channel protein